MKLLIVTQIVDTSDSALGFFHEWLIEFAHNCSEVIVICLKKGKYNLPENVRVFSLGKEEAQSSKVIYGLRFLRLIIKRRNEYDSVFIHMNPEYLVIGGLVWRFFGKKSSLWYLHKHVDLKLKIAVLFANKVITASKESFRYATGKLIILGHGIAVSVREVHRTNTKDTTIITTGRISSSKRIIEMLCAVEKLMQSMHRVRFVLVGAPVTGEDQLYFYRVTDFIKQSSTLNGKVTIMGSVPHAQIGELVASGDVFLNLSETGSLDKAVLEALFLGVPAVTSNVAFANLLSETSLFLEKIDPETVSEALKRALVTDITAITARVRAEHSLKSLIPRIVDTLK